MPYQIQKRIQVLKMTNLILKSVALLTLGLSFSQTWAASMCTETRKIGLVPATINCPTKSLRLPADLLGTVTRGVTYQIPQGSAPKEGWPVVFIYQGSFGLINNFFYASNYPFGIYHEGLLIQKLLDHGYAVIAPHAVAGSVWETNAPIFKTAYTTSGDYRFITNVLNAVKDGKFGPLNPNRQYAAGLSSGGYNTSRMAVSFPGQFKALAIQSASYATCLGPVCFIPENLPKDHPPTLLQHGSADLIVPWITAQTYYDRLLSQGIKTSFYTEPNAGHGWFASSPDRVLKWFEQNP